MKFLSIITPTYNSEKKILNCVNSVIDQNFGDYEHIIVDNCSSDQTMNLVNNINNKKIKTISENDNGIYYAMNKGAEISSGEYLLFLNSDDYLIDKNFFLNSSNILKQKKFDIFYSNIIYEKTIFNFKRKYISGKVLNKIKLGWHLPHPGTIINRNFFKKMNYFNTEYKISSDFDFFIRSQLKNDTKYYYYNYYTLNMSHGGVSSGLKNIIKSNFECYRSLKMNRYRLPGLFIIMKLIRKFFQFI